MAKTAADADQLTESIRRAKGDITDAESELDKVIGALESLARPEKVTISKVVHDAFEKLRAAKKRLEELEGVLKDNL